ncbi:TPA: streptolysin associated protein SagB, partial [Streptococcus pyogenes]
MSFFTKEQQPKENCPPITVEKARQLFEFNTNHLS